MANYTFKPAVREEVGLIIGIAGPSGSGKTYSAMRLASGIVGPGNRFALIDTENRRALHYADMFSFDHLDLGEPFRPDVYADAVKAADKAGYKAIVVDSMSHEWAGVDGILDWQEEELTRMAGDNWSKREACKMASWIKPKMAHKHMMARLLQCKANLILCFRAEEKVKMVTVKKDGRDKTEIVNAGWQPICEKNLPYELTVSMLLTPENPGVSTFLKLQEQHKPIFAVDKLISEACGKAISDWAKGGNLTHPSSTVAHTNNADALAISPQIKRQIHSLAQEKFGANYLESPEGKQLLTDSIAKAIGEEKKINTLTAAEADKVIAALTGLPEPDPEPQPEPDFAQTDEQAEELDRLFSPEQ